MNFLSQLKYIYDYFNDTTGCLIHFHTLLLQNKIAIALQNKIVTTQQNKIAIALQNSNRTAWENAGFKICKTEK